MSFNNNSYNKQACIIVVIVGSTANAAYFTIEKALLNINKIFYIAF
jgi:hypothetical protein